MVPSLPSTYEVFMPSAVRRAVVTMSLYVVRASRISRSMGMRPCSMAAI